MKPIHNRQSGMILIVVLLVVLITIILSVAYVARVVHEKTMADLEVKTSQALYASEGGGQAALAQIDTLINTNMLNTVAATTASVVSSQAANYVTNNDPIGFLVAYTKNGATALLTKTPSIAEATFQGNATGIDNSSYTYKIYFTPQGNPRTASSNVWDFPYYFKIQTTGTTSNKAKKFSINGDFTIRVQRDNFARYALFTNNQTLPNNTKVWFTSSTNFSGPMFSNGSYNFAHNPSGTFYGTVKQRSSLANFYNNGNTLLLNSDHNGTIDVPTFKDSFLRGQTQMTMASTSTEAAMASEAAGGTTISSNGIYIPNNGTNVTGGIYIYGNADSVALSIDADNKAVYTITQGATTKTIKVDTVNDQTSVTSGGTTTTYAGQPKGTNGVGTILYTNDSINSIGGSVQKDTQLTIATRNDAVIQNNITYQEYTAASGTPGQANYVAPSAEGYTNLMGIMSWTGDVRIGTSAPNDVQIHSTLMAQNGIVAVDNYATTAVRGTATIMGGVISNYYGGFGTFNGGTGQPVSGYGRNFVYDTRMETQYTPPYFPTMNTFIATTNDINDKKFWQTGGF